MCSPKSFVQKDLDTDRLHLHLTKLADIAKQKNLKLDSLNDVIKYLLL